MRLLYTLIFLLSYSTIFAQSILSDLQSLHTYNKKYDYYQSKDVSIDSIKHLIDLTHDNESELELLIFYLSKQFLIDMNDVYPEFDTAFQLAQKSDNILNKAAMYRYYALVKALDLEKDIALRYLDSAQSIISVVEDRVFESFLEYSRHIVFKFNEEHSKAIHFLLKSYELSRQYASQVVFLSRERMVIDYALDFKAVNALNIILSRRNIKQIPEKYRSFYLVSYSKYFDMIGQRDSALFYAKESYQTYSDQKSVFNYAKILAKDSSYEHSLSLLNNLILMKNPKESFFNDIYDEIANIYQSMGVFEKAKSYCNKSIYESRKMNERNREVEGLNRMASLFYESGNIDSSFQYASLAAQLAKERNLKYSYSTALLLKKGYYEYKRDEKKALETANALLELKSELSRLSVQSSMETNLIESEVGAWYKDQNRKLETAKNERDLLFIIALFFVAVIFMIFLLLYQKSKSLKVQIEQSNELSSQNKKISEQQELLKKINQDQDAIINKRTKKLVDLNRTLDQKNKRLELFSNIASHNLRGPISNLMSLTRFLGIKEFDIDQISSKMAHSVTVLDNVTSLLNIVSELNSEHVIQNEFIDIIEFMQEYTTDHFCIQKLNHQLSDSQVLIDKVLLNKICMIFDHRLLKINHEDQSQMFKLNIIQDQNEYTLSLHSAIMTDTSTNYSNFNEGFNPEFQSSLIDLYIVHLLCKRMDASFQYDLNRDHLRSIQIQFSHPSA